MPSRTCESRSASPCNSWAFRKRNAFKGRSGYGPTLPPAPAHQPSCIAPCDGDWSGNEIVTVTPASLRTSRSLWPPLPAKLIGGWLFDRDLARQLLSRLPLFIVAPAWPDRGCFRGRPFLAAAACASRRGLTMWNARSREPGRKTHRGIACVAPRRVRLCPPWAELVSRACSGRCGDGRARPRLEGPASRHMRWSTTTSWTMWQHASELGRA